MTTIADPGTLGGLVQRLRLVHPETPRLWGTLTAGEMLCHLGDAHELVLGSRRPVGPAAGGAARPLLKWAALYGPFRWPRGARGSASSPCRPG